MKKTLLVGALLLSATCFAQKASNKTLTLQVTAEPVNPLPETPVTYRSEIISPINPLSRTETMQAGSLEQAKRIKLGEMAKASLKLYHAKFIASEGSGANWLI